MTEIHATVTKNLCIDIPHENLPNFHIRTKKTNTRPDVKTDGLTQRQTATRHGMVFWMKKYSNYRRSSAKIQATFLQNKGYLNGKYKKKVSKVNGLRTLANRSFLLWFRGWNKPCAADSIPNLYIVMPHLSLIWGSRGRSPQKLQELNVKFTWEAYRVKIQEVFSKLPENTGITGGFHQNSGQFLQFSKYRRKMSFYRKYRNYRPACHAWATQMSHCATCGVENIKWGVWKWYS